MKHTRRRNRKNRRTKRGGINFANLLAYASAFTGVKTNEGQLQTNLQASLQPQYTAPQPIEQTQLHSAPTTIFRDFLSTLPDMPYLKLIQPLIDSSKLFCKDDFTVEEKEEFDKYQGGHYSYINKELRTHNLDRFKGTVKTMVSAMLKHPLETPLVVYRGSVGGGCKYNVHDRTITDDGFFSTTLTESVSMDSFSNSKTREMCVMEIEVPVGIPHAHLRRYKDTREESFVKMFFPNYSKKTILELENEVLFPPGMTITITGKKSEDGKTYLKGTASWDGIDALNDITGINF
jgi:hypothetical protein